MRSASGRRRTDGQARIRAVRAHEPRVRRPPVARVPGDAGAAPPLDLPLLRMPLPEQRPSLHRPGGAPRRRSVAGPLDARRRRPRPPHLRARLGGEMTARNVLQVMSGMIVAGYAVVALLFLRSWRDTRDRLFAIFAAAFALLAVQHLALSLSDQLVEERVYLYVLRLVAFLLILYAIADKNRLDRRTG